MLRREAGSLFSSRVVSPRNRMFRKHSIAGDNRPGDLGLGGLGGIATGTSIWSCIHFILSSLNEAGGYSLFPGHQTLTHTSNSSLSAKHKSRNNEVFLYDVDSDT